MPLFRVSLTRAARRPAAELWLQNRSCATAAAAAGAVPPAAPKKRRFRRTKWLLGAGGVIGGGLTYLYKKDDKERKERESSIRTALEAPVPTRASSIKRLEDDEEFDILIVGGGATGAGIALDASMRGLSVACLERDDFASGTSSKSTKLIWAGSRYLVKGICKLLTPSSWKDPVGAWEEFLGTFRMVMGCFRERTYMLSMNPHLTSWLPIAVPLDKWIIWPPPFGFYPAALGPCTGMFFFFFKFYDALGLWFAPSSYVMFPGQAQQEFPQLNSRALKYVNVFYEGTHNDARTNVAIALTASMKGACMANYTRVEKVVLDEQGKACGADVVDVSGPEPRNLRIRARKVVYAGGPYTDGMRQLSEGPDIKKVVMASGGTHIVLPQYFCPRHIGMVDMSTSRGSFLFFMPWEGYTLVGTTDVNTSMDVEHGVPEDDIQYLLNEAERYLNPALSLRRRDVMSAWYGVRPLCTDANEGQEASSVSRDHVVSHHPTNGTTYISGGKWTTWREMAEDCLTQVIERDEVLLAKAGPCQTLDTPLIGTGMTRDFPDGWHENLAVTLSQRYDLAFDIAQYLARTYGTRAAEVLSYAKNIRGSRSGLYSHYPRLYEGAAATTGYPYLEAEVLYACDHELAVSPADILARRTRLAFVNSTAARLTLPRVVEIMGDHLGWDRQRRKWELQRAEDQMAKDFAGPVPNKNNATIRRALAADVKDIFDSFDVNHNGQLSRSEISAASKELGFPLSDATLDRAMNEMDANRSGFVNFPGFLAWWNAEAQGDIQAWKDAAAPRGSKL